MSPATRASSSMYGPHQRRAERAVQADRQRPGVAHAVPERRHRLARQDATRGIGHGARDDHRQALAGVFHQLVEREDRGLRVQRVEDGLDQEQVAAAFEQPLGLLVVGRAQLLERDVARGRVVDVRADAGGPRRRARARRRRSAACRRSRTCRRPRGPAAPRRRSSRARRGRGRSPPARRGSRRRCWSRRCRRLPRGRARGCCAPRRAG